MQRSRAALVLRYIKKLTSTIKTIRLSSTHDVGRRAWKGTTYRNLFDSVQLIISITCIMLSNIVIIVVIVIIRNIIIVNIIITIIVIVSDFQKRFEEAIIKDQERHY